MTPRHLALVYRGTGGVIGEDLVSRVCQGAADLVEERNPEWPATMGGLPVGAAGGYADVSMDRAVDLGVEAGKREFLAYRARNPDVRVVIGGYSAGAVVAARLRQWLLGTYPDAYLCSFSFGDPTRPYGGAYYLGPPHPGRGIGSWRYGDTTDWRHCWLADPADMYTSAPLGVPGSIMADCYDMVTATQLSDPLGTALAIASRIPDIAEKAGIPLPRVLGYLLDGRPGSGLLGIGLPLALGALSGFVRGGDPATLTGSAAAAYAARTALRFATTTPPTVDHTSYDTREAWPGQTYLGLAIQHVRHWSSTVRAT